MSRPPDGGATGYTKEEMDFFGGPNFPGNLVFRGGGPSPAQIARMAEERQLSEYVERKAAEIAVDEGKMQTVKSFCRKITTGKINSKFLSSILGLRGHENQKRKLYQYIATSDLYKNFTDQDILSYVADWRGDKVKAAKMVLDIVLEKTILQEILSDFVTLDEKIKNRHPASAAQKNPPTSILEKILEKIKSGKPDAEIVREINKIQDLRHSILIDKVNETREEAGMLILSEAIAFGRVDLVKFLFDKGVDFKKKFSLGRTPLFCIVKKNDRVLGRHPRDFDARQRNREKMMDALLERFEDDSQRIEYLKECDMRGENVLMYAAVHGDIKAIDLISRKMLELGMDLNQEKITGGRGFGNAIDLAIEYQNFDAAMLLLERGVVPRDILSASLRALKRNRPNFAKELVNRIVDAMTGDGEVLRHLNDSFGYAQQNINEISTDNFILVLDACIKKYQGNIEVLKQMIKGSIIQDNFSDLIAKGIACSKRSEATSVIDFLANIDPKFARAIDDLKDLSPSHVSNSMHAYLLKRGSVDFKNSDKMDLSHRVMQYLVENRDFEGVLFEKLRIPSKSRKDYAYAELAVGVAGKVFKRLQVNCVGDDDLDSAFGVALNVAGIILDLEEKVKEADKRMAKFFEDRAGQIKREVSAEIKANQYLQYDFGGIKDPLLEEAIRAIDPENELDFSVPENLAQHPELEKFGFDSLKSYLGKLTDRHLDYVAKKIDDSVGVIRRVAGTVARAAEKVLGRKKPEAETLAGPAAEPPSPAKKDPIQQLIDLSPTAEEDPLEKNRKRTEAIVIEQRRREEQRMADEKFTKEQLARERAAFEARQRQRAEEESAEKARAENEAEKRAMVADLERQFAALGPTPSGNLEHANPAQAEPVRRSRARELA